MVSNSSDGELVDRRSGLLARADATGRVVFSYRYWSKGKRRRFVIGLFPAITLHDARIAVGQIREQVRAGSDPQIAREQQRAAPTTLSFDRLADLFLERHSKRVKASWREDARYLQTNLRPLWGPRDVSTIGRREIVQLLFAHAEQAPIAANRLRALLGKMFSWAVDVGLLDTSPMFGVRRPSSEGRGRERTLSDTEIRVLWRAFETAKIALSSVAALKVMLLLGARAGEVVGMSVDELHNLDDAHSAYWELPPERMKSRRRHAVPLVGVAREIVLEELSHQVRPHFVFESRSGAQLPRPSLVRILVALIKGLDPNGPDADVVARLQTDRPVAHDLRRTVATGLSKLKVPREDRLALLAHAPRDVHGQVYDHHDRMDERRAALLRWDAHLRKVILDEATTTETVTLRHARGLGW